VIRAFNQDKPYDVFLREQLAGDELDAKTDDTLIATGFLRAGPRVAFREKDNPERRYEYLDDLIATTGRGLLGLTVQCARCHNHKFDPIPQKDYYSLVATFFGYVETTYPLVPRAQAQAHEKAVQEIQARQDALKAEIKKIDAPYVARLRREAYKRFPENVQQAIAKPEGERTPGEQLLAQQIIDQSNVSRQAIARVLTPEDEARKRALDERIAALEKEKPKPLPVAEIVTDGDYRFAPDGDGDEVIGCPKCRIPDVPTGSFLHTGPGRYEAPPSYFLLRGAPEAVLNKVPSGADFVAVAHLDPSASQKMNLFRMTQKFPDLGSQEQLTQKANGMLDDALSGSGLTHEDLGWVGGELGGYADVGAGSPSYAVMIASDDNGAASAALQKMRDTSGTTYTSSTVDGVEVWSPASSDQPAEAIVDDTVVLASSVEAMQTVITTSNSDTTIQDDATFTGVMDKLPDDNLGFVYVNVGSIASLANLIPGQTGGLGSQLDAYQGAAYSITAEPNGLAIDAAVTTDPSKLTAAQRDALGSGPNPLLALTPADAYAVVASSGIGSALADSVTQAAQLGPGPARTIERLGLIGPNGVLQHLTGDLGLQVGPGSGLLPVGGTVMLGVDDAAAVQTWLDEHAPGLLGQAGIPGLSSSSLKTEDYQGVRITYGATPTTPIAWGVVDRALVVGLSAKAVEQAVDLSQGNGSSITSNGDFTAATDGLPGTQTLLYVDVNGILTAAQGILPDDVYQQFLDAGGRDLQPIKVVVAGSSETESLSTYRLFIEIP
jgi:hypothetical protein